MVLCGEIKLKTITNMKTIKLAWKALARFRTYTFINILGLALSLACVLIILRYIHQEVTVNHFCKAVERSVCSEKYPVD